MKKLLAITYLLLISAFIGAQNKYLNLSWKNLHIKTLTKPYSELATLVLK